jgi:hypothetical protein
VRADQSARVWHSFHRRSRITELLGAAALRSSCGCACETKIQCAYVYVRACMHACAYACALSGG